MSRNSKGLVGILSFAPLILGCIIIIMLLNMIPDFFNWDRHEPDFYTVFSTISPLVILAIFACMLSIGLLIFFIVHLVNNKNMESVEKLIWILAFLLAGSISYPIYWYMRIWHEKV